MRIDSPERFLDDLLRNGVYHGNEQPLSEQPLPNYKLVRQVLQQSIVVEQSPVEAVSFISLLKRAKPSDVAIGAYVGYAAANGNYLLLLTVPAGILLVGSAIAITAALPKILASRFSSEPTPKKRRSSGGQKPPRAASA